MVVLTAKDIAADQAEKKAGILCVFQVLFCEELREENRCQAIRDFRRRPKKYIALQSVWVQCDTLGVSHICIFPSDGTNRIRFTGKGYQAHSQPDASGSPKTYLLLRSEIIIAQIRCLSRKNYAAGLLASQKKRGEKQRFSPQTYIQAIFSDSFAPPRIWKCRCCTLWQASVPQLLTTR